MNVEFVSIGDELLLGFTIDTNAAHFARATAEQGIRVVRRSTVGDGAEGIAAAVREALDRTGAVITSGGLGPTADDLTKPAIAALFGRAMQRDDAILDALRARWKARGWPGELPKTNEQQAMIPEGAVILENRHGSAPGIWLEDERGRWVAMLPGVPREFRGMTGDTLLPRLAAMRTRAGSSTVVRSRTLRTTGIAESALADALGELAKDPHGVSLAYLPGWEGVDLRLTAWDLPAAAADARLEQAAAALMGKVGKHVYAEGETDLVTLVLDRLRARRLKVAVAESCTGGMLGMRLTAIPGSSESVVGGVIAYDNSVKVRDLGVREATLAAHGAVSEETAREMASGARARFGVDAAMGITGIAGPGGGTPEKPVGTFCVAVDLGGEVRSLRTSSVGDRHEVRQRATQAALSLLRRLLDETRG
jgi:nicotinamide-nucleotide amidase